MTKPRFFKTRAAFTGWLAKNHDRATELWVGFYKKASGKPGLTWPESVDAALCFGWIDGVRKSMDDESYMIRFSPRREGSIWSAVNIRSARRLVESGEMQPSGLKAFERRREDRSRVYSFEQGRVALGRDQERRLRANAKAWTYWKAQPPSYRRTVTHWVMSAKREETRERRFDALIEDSEAGRWVRPMRIGRSGTKSGSGDGRG
ncbi:MAG: YdeI/OmpD-associated family protein [Gemmatimonadetes bacterium]|nr:YdeI/OmpD-associated family protein [Gemmatimonadota bacterium]